MSLQALDKPQPSKPLRVAGKLREACMLLVHEGLPWKEAAEKAGFTPRALLYALERPHVQAFLKQQRDVLRSSMCGRNILVLAEVRDQTSNQMARVNAVQALERIEDQSLNAGPQRSAPGLVIVFEGGAVTGHVDASPAKPLIDHEPVQPSGSERDE